ncbi:NAD-dependent epimerase/dehydratase family protein [Hymenobacter wooponensis]|uniref:NAD(P)-dependent oxidoreductase n=1 Tax=Hymenobacter wooponensis TaxID=1525360 RepID=A0A4Z0MUK6_9BACT|nr:NAD(P)-dependent oxidoreductase [Hymenobacter wooponensis]TGD82998.1 NAD(P)-dependent oxidoreductase [Hymenobacter wooponensis]
MKVAIIGSNSLLASYVIDEFSKEENYQLVLFGKEAKDDERDNIIFNLFQYPQIKVELSSLLDCDVIVYCAATGVQAGGKADSDIIYDVNAFYPIKILNYLSENGFSGKWVSFGSYFEIGDTSQVSPLNEEQVLSSYFNIPNHYCSSKRLLTKFIVNNIYNVKVFHFVLPTIYGERENPNRLIPYIINSLQKGQPMKLSAGTQIRQYLHCADVASMVRLIAENDLPIGIYNLANEAPIQIATLVKYIFSIFNRDATPFLGTANTRDESMKYLAISSEKASAQIPEWRPSIGIEEGIRRYIGSLSS